MIIKCEKCSSSFNLKDSLVKPEGSKVRCSKCKHIFIVYPPEPEIDIPMVQEPEPTPVVPEMDISEEKPVDAAPDTHTKEEDDLNLELAFDSEPPEEKPESEDLELDLSFDTPDDLETSEPESLADQGEDELDFSDIGKILDGDDHSDDVGLETGFEESELKLELADDEDGQEDALDFEGIDEMIDTESDQAELPEDDSDMDLELSLADDDEPASAINDSDEDLDFSELEKILEDDDFMTEEEHGDEDLDLDLDLALASDEEDDDLKLEMEEPSADDDMDFSDIEEMLESEDEGTEEPELVMEPKDEDDFGEIPDDDFEFSLEDDQPEEPEPTDATPESEEDMDISIDIEEDDTEEMLPDEPEDALADPEDEEELDEEEAMDAPAEKPRAQKKKTSPLLVVLLILVAIGGGGYATMKMLNIDITQISAMLTGESTEQRIDDPGNLNISTQDVRSKFINNRKDGRIFVITGKVTNNYPAPRSHIAITGKLFAKDKVLSQTEQVYAGNFLSDIDLTQMEMAAISQRLQTQNGDNNINVGLKPHDSIPFMIVFSNLPEDLAEFTIQVDSSTRE